jgi:hypothetical protein
MSHYLVPQHETGDHHDVAYIVPTEDVDDATDAFVDAKERLMDVNNWGKYSHLHNISFLLKDSHGKHIGRHARKGDHISVDIAGSTLPDWVAIEAIEYDDYPDMDAETFGMRVHACTDPAGRPVGDAASMASGTFVIERRGKQLMATYHSRNNSDHNTRLPLLTEDQWQRLLTGIGEPYYTKK